MSIKIPKEDALDLPHFTIECVTFKRIIKAMRSIAGRGIQPVRVRSMAFEVSVEKLFGWANNGESSVYVIENIENPKQIQFKGCFELDKIEKPLSKFDDRETLALYPEIDSIKIKGQFTAFTLPLVEISDWAFFKSKTPEQNLVFSPEIERMAALDTLELAQASLSDNPIENLLFIEKQVVSVVSSTSEIIYNGTLPITFPDMTLHHSDIQALVKFLRIWTSEVNAPLFVAISGKRVHFRTRSSWLSVNAIPQTLPKSAKHLKLDQLRFKASDILLPNLEFYLEVLRTNLPAIPATLKFRVEPTQIIFFTSVGSAKVEHAIPATIVIPGSPKDEWTIPSKLLAKISRLSYKGRVDLSYSLTEDSVYRTGCIAKDKNRILFLA